MAKTEKLSICLTKKILNHDALIRSVIWLGRQWKRKLESFRTLFRAQFFRTRRVDYGKRHSHTTQLFLDYDFFTTLILMEHKSTTSCNTQKIEIEHAMSWRNEGKTLKGLFYSILYSCTNLFLSLFLSLTTLSLLCTKYLSSTATPSPPPVAAAAAVAAWHTNIDRKRERERERKRERDAKSESGFAPEQLGVNGGAVSRKQPRLKILLVK